MPGCVPSAKSSITKCEPEPQLPQHDTGLVILIPAVNRAVQQRLFKAALDELAVIGEPVNRVLEVDLDGEEVTLSLYDLP